MGPDRRRPARPGRRARAPGDSHVPARPLAGPARAIPARRQPAVRARGPRVRRARRAAVELRALGAGRGRGRRRHRPRHPGRRDQPGLRRRHPRRPVRRDGRRRWPARWQRAGSRSASSPAPRTSSPARPSRPARSSADSRRRPSAAARRCCSNPGPGTRCASSPSPFVARFDEERRRLIAEGRPAEEVREALEGLNVGRLRVAAKGVDRVDGAGSLAGAGRRRLPAGAWPVHARPGGHSAGRDDHHRRAPPRDRRRAARRTSIARSRRSMHGRGRGPTIAVGHRHHRHVGGLPRRGRRGAVLVQHAARRRRDHRDPAGPLGLAAVLRPRPEGARQDRLEVGRVPAGRRVRPAAVRHAAVEPAVDRAGAVAGAGGRARRRWATPATPSGRSPASGRPSCWAWAAARRNWRWATPSARTCRCSTR